MGLDTRKLENEPMNWNLNNQNWICMCENWTWDFGFWYHVRETFSPKSSKLIVKGSRLVSLSACPCIDTSMPWGPWPLVCAFGSAVGGLQLCRCVISLSVEKLMIWCVNLFLQWVDCVSQLIRMYPFAFEFSTVCIFFHTWNVFLVL